MRSRERSRTTKKPVPIGPWPDDARTPAEVAAEVEFLGSPEHKDHANPVNGEAAGLRDGDGFRCARFPPERWLEFTELLRRSVAAQVTSAAFDPDQRAGRERVNGWPRYVWGWFDGRLFEARHRTDPPGVYYKAYLLDAEQYPSDPRGLLDALRRAAR